MPYWVACAYLCLVAYHDYVTIFGILLGARLDLKSKCKGKSEKPILGLLRDLRAWIAVILTVICLIVLGLNARLPSVGEAFRGADYRLIGLAMLVSELTIVLKAARWRALYPPLARPKFGLTVVGTAVGQMANWAIPARLGEVFRLGLVTSEKVDDRPVTSGAAFGIGVLVAEKLVDGAMLLAAIVLLSITGGSPTWLSRTGLLLVGLACIFLSTIFLVQRRRRLDEIVRSSSFLRLGKLLPERLSSLLGHAGVLGEGLSSWLQPWMAANIAFWSLGVWIVGGVINYLVLQGVNIDQNFAASLAILVALYGGAVVPSLPGRVGLFQGICVVALAYYGVDFDRAVAYSLALYAVIYLPPIITGLLSVLIMGAIPERRGNGVHESAT